MWDFSWKNRAALGIDIGSSAVKVLQLRRQGRSYRVERCAIRPLPVGAVVEKRIADAAAVGAVLSEMGLPLHRVARRAVVAVPGSAVITKQLEFDAALSDAELELHVSLEAERHIPYAPSEVALDFTRLEPPHRNATSAPVLLAACRKEHVDGRVAALSSAGYEAAVVEVETQAVERAFALLGEIQGLAALADLGAAFSTLYILRDGVVIHVREQAAGQTQPLQSSRFDSVNSKPMIPEQSPRELVTQLNRALQLFYSASNYHSVDRVVLAGGGAMQPELVAMAEQTLRLPVTVANPFAAISCDVQMDAAQLTREGPLLFLAAGLALRGLRDG